MSDRRECLKGFKLSDLYMKIGLSDDEFINWLQELGIIPKDRTCECGSDMRIQKMRNTKRFVCRKKKDCGKSVALFDNTFFSGAHLSAKEV